MEMNHVPDLRKNRVRHKLEQGERVAVVQGIMTPDLAEYFGYYGFDGVWAEAEHGPVDYGDIADFARACDLWGVTPIVRVNLNLPGVIYRSLDQGALGVVVPHVNTAEEARAVVDAAKHYPIGSRGSYAGRQGIGVDRYVARANEETVVVVLIEDIVAVENLSEILKVDHINVFFVAPGDLAQTMGYPGEPTRAEVQEVVDRSIGQIVAAGRVAGAMANPPLLEHYLDLGARFLSTNWVPTLETVMRPYAEKVAAAR